MSRETYRKLDTIKENLAVVASQTDVGKDKVKRAISDKGVVVEAPVGANPTFEALAKGVASIKQTGTINVNSLKESTAILSEDVEAGDLLEGYNRVPSPTITGVDNMFEMSKFMNLKLSDSDYSTPMMMPMYRELGLPQVDFRNPSDVARNEGVNNGTVTYPTDLDLEKSVDFVTAYDGKYLLYIIHHSHIDDVSANRVYNVSSTYALDEQKAVNNILGLPNMRSVSIHTYVRLDGEYIYDPDKSLFNIGLVGYGNLYESICPLNGVMGGYTNSRILLMGYQVLVKPLGDSGKFFSIIQGGTSEQDLYSNNTFPGAYGFGVLRFNEDGTWKLVYDGGTNTDKLERAEWAKPTGKFYDPLITDFSQVCTRSSTYIRDIRVCLSEEGQTGKLVVLSKVVPKVKGVVGNEANFEDTMGYTVFTYNVDMLDTEFNMVPVVDNPFFIACGLNWDLRGRATSSMFYHSCLSHKEQWIKYIGTGTKTSPEGEYIILDSSMITPRYAANSCSLNGKGNDIRFDSVIPFILFRHKGNSYFELMCLMEGAPEVTTIPPGGVLPGSGLNTTGLGQHLQYGACLNWNTAPYGNMSTMSLNGGKPYTKWNSTDTRTCWVSWKMDVAYAYLGDKFLSQMCWWFYSNEFPTIADTPTDTDSTRKALLSFGVKTPRIIGGSGVDNNRFVNYYYKIEIIENVDKDKEVVCLLQYTKPSRNFGRVYTVSGVLNHEVPGLYGSLPYCIGRDYLKEPTGGSSYQNWPRNIVVATWKLNTTSEVDLLTHLTARGIILPPTNGEYFQRQAFRYHSEVNTAILQSSELVVLQNVDLLRSSYYVDASNLHHMSIQYSHSYRYPFPEGILSNESLGNIKAFPPLRVDIIWEDKVGVPTLFPLVPKGANIQVASIPILGTTPSLYQGNQGRAKLLDPLQTSGLGLSEFRGVSQNHQYYMFLVKKDIAIQLVCSNPPNSNLMVSPFSYYNGTRVLNNCGISGTGTPPPITDVNISMNQIAKPVFYRNINYKKLGTPPLYHMFKEGAKLEFSPQPPLELGLDSCEDPNSKLFKYAQDLDNTAIIQKLNEKYLVTLNRTTKTISLYGLKTDSHGLPTYTKLSSTYTIEFSTLGSLDWETNFTITEVDVEGVFYIGYIQSDMPTILKVVNGEILPTPITIRPTNILPVICIALGKDAKTVVISLNQAPYVSAFYDVSTGTSWAGRNYFKVDITDIPSGITPVLKYTPDYQYLISCSSSHTVVRDNGNGTFTKIPHIGSTTSFRNALPTQTMPMVVAIGSNIRVIKEKGATYYEFVLFNRDYRELLKANNNNYANYYSRPNGGGFGLYSIQKTGDIERVYRTIYYSGVGDYGSTPDFTGLTPNAGHGPHCIISTGNWERSLIPRRMDFSKNGFNSVMGIPSICNFNFSTALLNSYSMSQGASYCGYLGNTAIPQTSVISSSSPASHWRKFKGIPSSSSVNYPGILSIPHSGSSTESMGYDFSEIRDIAILENGDIYILGNVPISFITIMKETPYGKYFYDNNGMVTHLTRRMIGYGNIVTSNKQRSKYLHETSLYTQSREGNFEGYSQVETLVIKSKLDLALTYTFNSGGNNIRLHTNRASLIIGDYCCNTVSIKAKKTNNLLNIIGYLNPFGFNTVDEGLYSTNRGGPDPTGKSLLTQQSSNSWNKPDYILIAKEKGKVGDVVNCEILLDTNK